MPVYMEEVYRHRHASLTPPLRLHLRHNCNSKEICVTEINKLLVQCENMKGTKEIVSNIKGEKLIEDKKPKLP